MDFPTVHRMRVEHASKPPRPKLKTITQVRAEKIAAIEGSRAGELGDWQAGDKGPPRTPCSEKAKAYIYECLQRLGGWVGVDALAEYSGYARNTVNIAMHHLRHDPKYPVEIRSERRRGLGWTYLYRCTRAA